MPIFEIAAEWWNVLALKVELPSEVIESPRAEERHEINKLKARYPGGEFDVYYSENRKAGDL